MKKGKFKDIEIIEGLVTNDLQIYQYLDAVYREKVLRHVKLNSGTSEEGEEHYQDVIVEIYFKIISCNFQLNESQSFESYFWIVAKRRWIDKLRKSKIMLVPLENQFEDIFELEDEFIALKERLILLIEKYLPQLTDEEREYVNLYYFAMNSIKSIAIKFKTTSGYAQLKLHRIRKKLRKLIEADPEFATLVNLY